METYQVTVYNGDGDQVWKQNNLWHRLDGPAHIYPNGDESWWKNGKMHRLDGPATTFSGHKSYWIEGVKYTKKEFDKYHGDKSTSKAVPYQKGENMETYEVTVNEDGDQTWRQNGEPHRIGGPAYIGSSGYEAWYKEGKYHRLDGPAVIFAGGKEYWKDGERHRLDGPAFIHTEGLKEYWIEGKKYTKEEFDKYHEDKSSTKVAEFVYALVRKGWTVYQPKDNSPIIHGQYRIKKGGYSKAWDIVHLEYVKISPNDLAEFETRKAVQSIVDWN